MLKLAGDDVAARRRGTGGDAYHPKQAFGARLATKDDAVLYPQQAGHGTPTIIDHPRNGSRGVVVTMLVVRQCGDLGHSRHHRLEGEGASGILEKYPGAGVGTAVHVVEAGAHLAHQGVVEYRRASLAKGCGSQHLINPWCKRQSEPIP